MTIKKIEQTFKSNRVEQEDEGKFSKIRVLGDHYTLYEHLGLGLHEWTDPINIP